MSKEILDQLEAECESLMRIYPDRPRWIAQQIVAHYLQMQAAEITKAGVL